MQSIKEHSKTEKTLKTKTAIAGALALAILTLGSISPAVAEGTTDVPVEVVVSTTYVPRCEGLESLPDWAPDTQLAYDGIRAASGSVDPTILSSITVALDLGWSQGQDQECTPITHNGTVTSSLTMTDPGVAVSYLDCDASAPCSAVDMLDILGELDFSAVADGTYSGTLSVVWAP